MTIEQLVPRVGTVEVGELLDRLRRAPRCHGCPFDPLRIDFSDAIARAIFTDQRSRASPAVMAVAFWLRRAAISRLARRFEALEAEGFLRAPRGLAFHLPPTNVDSLFLYSLMISFLVGNLNVVRVSRDRLTAQVALLCELLRRVLADKQFSEFGDELAVLSYAHEAEPTAAFSREADVRLLWGDDETIARMRSVPISAAAHDVTFGDRFSFAVIRAGAVAGADRRERHALAEGLFNDAYWFDQRACSSPRLLVWVGDSDEVQATRQILFSELAHVVADKSYRLDAGTTIAKLTFVYQALIDRPVESVYQACNELLVLSLRHLAGFDRTHPGAGLFFDCRVDALEDLVMFVKRKDQTVTSHGFSAEELRTFARSLRGRGVDRIVGFGEALHFGSLWDGYDLLAELTRTISVGGQLELHTPRPHVPSESTEVLF